MVQRFQFSSDQSCFLNSSIEHWDSMIHYCQITHFSKFEIIILFYFVTIKHNLISSVL